MVDDQWYHPRVVSYAKQMWVSRPNSGACTMKFNYIHACNCVVIATEPASLLQSMTIANVALKRAKRAVIFPQLTDHSQAGWNS